MVSAAIDQAEGTSAIPQALELPPAREFITSAGFGGALALLAVLLLALIVVVTGWRGSRRHREELDQREQHFEAERDERERAADLAVCSERFKWVVETAGIEPAAGESATLGLGPEVALELLAGLHRDATRLGDETLVKAIAVYLNQFSLVLAQQGGQLSHLNAGPAGAGDGSTAAAKPAARKRAPRVDAKPGPAVEPSDRIPASEPTPDSLATTAGELPGRRRRR